MHLFRLNLHRARWDQDATKTPRSLGIHRSWATLGPAQPRRHLLWEARKSRDSAQVLLYSNLRVSKVLLRLLASPVSLCPRTAPGRCWPCRPLRGDSSLGCTSFLWNFPASQPPGSQPPADLPILHPPTLHQLHAGQENPGWSRYPGTFLFSDYFPSRADLKSILESDFSLSCCFQDLSP